MSLHLYLKANCHEHENMVSQICLHWNTVCVKEIFRFLKEAKDRQISEYILFDYGCLLTSSYTGNDPLDFEFHNEGRESSYLGDFDTEIHIDVKNDKFCVVCQTAVGSTVWTDWFDFYAINAAAKYSALKFMEDEIKETTELVQYVSYLKAVRKVEAPV